MTIDDVAAAAGVSTATVSRALSRPSRVSSATRLKVLEVIKRLNYVPNAAAKTLRTTLTGRILVTLPDISNPFFSKLTQGIEEAAKREGYTVLLGETHYDAEVEEKYSSMLQRREADGLIFLGHLMPSHVQSWMRTFAGLPPVVSGNGSNPKFGVPCVHVDNERASADVIDHLHDLGHRRIGVITGPLSIPLVQDRLKGVKKRARSMSTKSLLAIFNGNFSIESGIVGAARLLAPAAPPTAIYCFNDEMAMGVLHYANRIGKSIPKDLSVVGFDDIRFAQYTRPALTTVSQPMSEIGREAVRLLVGILSGSVTEAVTVVPRYKLEVRESTGPVPRM